MFCLKRKQMKQQLGMAVVGKGKGAGETAVKKERGKSETAIKKEKVGYVKIEVEKTAMVGGAGGAGFLVGEGPAKRIKREIKEEQE